MKELHKRVLKKLLIDAIPLLVIGTIITIIATSILWGWFHWLLLGAIIVSIIVYAAFYVVDTYDRVKNDLKKEQADNNASK